jgi:2-amino-4-hydroxy-6-hydroxymethyldihydropteridine diphosphokinase
MPKRLVFIGLGSNQGDREQALGTAIEALHGQGLAAILKSSLYRTDPVEVIDQDEFINQVVGCDTPLSPERILEACLVVEQSMGRLRTRDKGPRRIDLDLLLAGEDVRQEAALKVPHPRMHLRLFVLVPLAEIAPAAWHPVLRMTAAGLLRACPDRSRVERLEPSVLKPGEGPGLLL